MPLPLPITLNTDLLVIMFPQLRAFVPAGQPLVFRVAPLLPPVTRLGRNALPERVGESRRWWWSKRSAAFMPLQLPECNGLGIKQSLIGRGTVKRHKCRAPLSPHALPRFRS
jgi:hypothetical protein